jgi:hypothetical protein
MLGRPFGAPNDPAFQRRVLQHLLALFERGAGPVLEDFPDEAPGDPGDAEGYACPVSFERAALADDDIAGALLAEIAQLAAWHAEALRRRGRSTVGIAGMPVEDAAKLIGSMLPGGADEANRSRAVQAHVPADIALGTLLKRCCDDIKAYYFEAAGAQPGQLSAQAIDRWFWGETAAARAFLRLREVGLDHSDASVRLFVERSLVPRAILHARASA